MSVVEKSSAIAAPARSVSILLSCWGADDLIDGYVSALLDPDIVSQCELVAVDFPNSHANPAFVRGHLLRYPGAKVVSVDEPLSLYEAWNLAVHHAGTEYVANLNLDDRVTSDYYQVGVRALREHAPPASEYLSPP